MFMRSASLTARRISNTNSRLSGGPLPIRGTSGGTREPDIQDPSGTPTLWALAEHRLHPDLLDEAEILS